MVRNVGNSSLPPPGEASRSEASMMSRTERRPCKNVYIKFEGLKFRLCLTWFKCTMARSYAVWTDLRTLGFLPSSRRSLSTVSSIPNGSSLSRGSHCLKTTGKQSNTSASTHQTGDAVGRGRREPPVRCSPALLFLVELFIIYFMLKNHLTLTTMWKHCLSHCSQKFQLKILTQDQNWPLKTDWSGSRALCWWHVSYQVLLASKKSTKKSFSSSSVRLHSPPSLSTSTGGTGMGMPLWRSPSWGMSGSTIWKRSFGQSQLMYVVQHEKQNQSSDHGWVRRVSSALGPDQVQRWELCLSVYRQKCRLSCEQDIPIFVINSHSGLWSKV